MPRKWGSVPILRTSSGLIYEFPNFFIIAELLVNFKEKLGEAKSQTLTDSLVFLRLYSANLFILSYFV